MNDLSDKEQVMRHYWLGAFSAEQTESFEIDWFASDIDAELLQIARADLIDDYLADNLTGKERTQFERNFLPDNLEDIVLAKSSIEISREELAVAGKKNFFEGFLSGFHGLFRLPQIAVATALLLLVCFGLWFKFSGGYSEPMIARNESPSAGNLQGNQPESSENSANINAGDSNAVKNANVKINKDVIEHSENVNRNSTPNKKQVIDTAPAAERRQIIFLTVLRGEQKTVTITGSHDLLTLKITMPGIDKEYQTYQLRIDDSTGKRIVNQSLGGGLSLKKSGDVLTMPPLKGSLFKKNNTYKTSLVGIDENGTESELITYDAFKVQ